VRAGERGDAGLVRRLVREGWEEFIKVDKRLLSTLGLLLFRPGYLTGEYVRGRRTAYISPFKMYITVSALFFLVFGLVVPFDTVNDWDNKANELDRTIAAAQKKAEAESKKKPSGAPAETSPSRAGGAKNIGADDKPTPNQDFFRAWKEFRSQPIRFFGRKVEQRTLPSSVTKYREEQESKPIAERDKPIRHYFTERLIRFINSPADSAKTLFSTGLPFLLLIQLPLFAIWMRILYFRQRRLYVEHLVFLLHTHTFFFLLFGVIFAANALAQSLGTNIPMLDMAMTWIMLTGIVTFYNILAYRRFYSQGWGKTLVKGWFLLNGYVFLLAFTFAISATVAILWTLFAPG
jgi:uncharacterized protein with PQ loop repeat